MTNQSNTTSQETADLATSQSGQGMQKEVTVHDFTGQYSGDVYDQTQTDNSIKDGDVLDLGAGNVAIMVEAWPTIVVGEIEQFHKLSIGASFETYKAGRYAASAKKAREISSLVLNRGGAIAHELTFNQPIGYQLGGFTVGHSAMMNGSKAVGTIVGVEDVDGRRKVTLEFAEPQATDVDGVSCNRFELDFSSISSTWERPSVEVKVQNFFDGEVVGVDSDRHLIQWSADARSTYNSGETLEEFGVTNLSALELQRAQGNLENCTNRYQVFPMDEGNDQWGVIDMSTQLCWSSDGWQKRDSGWASVLTKEESLKKAVELDSAQPKLEQCGDCSTSPGM